MIINVIFYGLNINKRIDYYGMDGVLVLWGPQMWQWQNRTCTAEH